MRALLAIIANDCRLLIRDKMGLIILFVLPMLLIVVMSMMQSGIDTGNKRVDVALINQSNQVSNQQLIDRLLRDDLFNWQQIKNNAITVDQIKQEIVSGHYRIAILLTQGQAGEKQLIDLYLDPTLPNSIANSLHSKLNATMLAMHIDILEKQLPIAWRQRLEQKNKPPKLVTHYLDYKNQTIKPSVAEQNVAAWTLFGMFFIIVPLASQLVRDRSECINQRLYLTPVPPFIFMLGRSSAYILLNMLQLLLMLIVGIFLLPYLGVPGFTIAGKLTLVLLIGFFAALSATSLGIFIGICSKTQQQVTSIAPFVIVLMAAVSGIFMPTYLMPDLLASIGALSPMHWGQEAFLDVYARGGNLSLVFPELVKLFIFSAVVLTVSLAVQHFKRR